MKKKCYPRLLPTEDASQICIGSALNGLGLNFTESMVSKNPNFINHHLHMLSDDKIEEGDWCVKYKGQVKYNGSYINKYHPDYGSGFQKIIATTDLLLNPPTYKQTEGVFCTKLPSISQQFIEEYCKNPVEEVMVEYYCKPIFNSWIEAPKLTDNNEIIISPVEEKMYTEKDMDAAYDKGFADGLKKNL